MNEAMEIGTLRHAFRSFERAAVVLEERHDVLRERVELLERDLVDSSRRLETVIDALDSGVAVVSSDGTLLRTNRAFDRMRLVRADGSWLAPELARLFREPVRTGSVTRFRHESRSGPRDLSATIVPVEDAGASRVLTVQDVTDIRREEQEGGRRRRLEALGRMAAELAHEVRNPLGSIRLFGEMLVEDLAGDPRSMAEQILAAACGLERTVANLLSFANPPRAERRQVDLARIVDETCDLVAPACDVRNVKLEHAHREPCVIVGEAEGLRQIVLNLIGNSLAATDSGGRIRVETRRGAGRALLLIEDDGRGIAPEDLPRVFDPFFSRTEGGTGLGLSIVHRTVERHAGRITIDSHPDSGTRVRIELATDDPVIPQCEELPE